MTVKVETVVPTAMMPLDQLDGENLLIRVMQVGKTCVINLAEDSRFLSNFCDKLDRGEVWKKVAPTWDEFCVKAFGHPSYYVDMIRTGVSLLDKGDGAPISAEEARRAALSALAQKVPELSKNGTNRFSDRSRLPRPISEGTTSEYLVARIKRDRPDIAERILNGEFKSVSDAAREAGIPVHPTVKLGKPETLADAIIRLMGREYASTLASILNSKSSDQNEGPHD